jgi:hypothetical protein
MSLVKDNYSRELFKLRNKGVAYKNSTPDRSIDDIGKDTKRLQNKALEQDINLRKETLKALFVFLGIETLIIFLFSLFQATGFIGFKLEEWSFKLLTTTTIVQITIMLQVAVKYLFPER